MGPCGAIEDPQICAAVLSFDHALLYAGEAKKARGMSCTSLELFPALFFILIFY